MGAHCTLCHGHGNEDVVVVEVEELGLDKEAARKNADAVAQIAAAFDATVKEEGPAIDPVADAQPANAVCEVKIADDPCSTEAIAHTTEQALASEALEATSRNDQACADEKSAAVQAPQSDSRDASDRIKSFAMGPLGAGAWCATPKMTDEMQRLKDEAISLFKTGGNGELTPFNLDFLSPMTLHTYLVPVYHADILMKCCVHRAAMEAKLTGKVPIRLNGSCRILGWDEDGRSIILLDCSTMTASLSELLDHFEYVFWTALDCNKPGVNRVVVIVDFGGGYNWRHFLSMRALMDLVQLLSQCLHERLEGLFILDMPSTFQGVYSTIMKFAEGDTRRRIRGLVGIEQLLTELQERRVEPATIAQLDELLKKSRRKRKDSAPKSWVPILDAPFFQDQLQDLNIGPDTECITEEYHKRFRQAIQENRVARWGCLRPEEG